MITLYGHVPAWGIPDLSPFVTKIDCYLRMTGTPYQLVLGALTTAPKGKLPYIEDGAITVADSSFILDYLRQLDNDRLDRHLTPKERAVALLFWRLMDESFYWSLVQARYRRDEDFKLYDPLWGQFYGDLSDAARTAAIQAARDRLLLEFYQSGRGRLSLAEAEQIGRRELDSIVAYLGDQPYLLGAQPTTADAAVHAFLQGLIYVPFENGIKHHALAEPTLMAYMRRISERYYPEFRVRQLEYAHAG